MILFDIPPMPYESPIALAVAAVFFLVLIAAAVIAFKMLKRTLKMAVRMTIVGIIVLVAIIGSIALMVGVSFSTYKPNRPPRPPINSTR